MRARWRGGIECSTAGVCGTFVDEHCTAHQLCIHGAHASECGLCLLSLYLCGTVTLCNYPVTVNQSISKEIKKSQNENP